MHDETFATLSIATYIYMELTLAFASLVTRGVSATKTFTASISPSNNYNYADHLVKCVYSAYLSNHHGLNDS